MNWNQIIGNWMLVQGKAQQQLGKILKSDLIILEGKQIELIGKIQRKYGIGKKEAEIHVDDICKGYKVRLTLLLDCY
ncbi:CsbD family protein [Nitrosomonas supralitoralis]|uniref:CsbD family protein n=1 Tax=Nitrosomonas supralitoralis TaxID=2116706 RepID=A0A2P7NSC5_9PROT|nr:CsbD family protein [Nitrosomonas supralitoralis]PSJ16381.1 CsbD family protein [Nitrosomonas supralitoralis]